MGGQSNAWVSTSMLGNCMGVVLRPSMTAGLPARTMFHGGGWADRKEDAWHPIAVEAILPSG